MFLGELDPDAIGPALAFATHYEPTPAAEIDALLDTSPLEPQRTTFVDLGAGMGRMVLHAARRPFRQVIGVEVSPALVAIARENRDRYRGPRACKDLRLVRADAAAFTFPRGDLLVYLYNPFTADVLAAVVDRLARHAAEVVVLYHTPVEAALFDAHPAFAPLASLPHARAWRLRREPAPERRMVST